MSGFRLQPAAAAAPHVQYTSHGHIMQAHACHAATLRARSSHPHRSDDRIVHHLSDGRSHVAQAGCVFFHLRFGRRLRPTRPKATRRLSRRVTLPAPPRCNRNPTHTSAICPLDLQFLRSRRLPAHLRRLILLPQKRQPALRRRSLLREPRPPGSQLRANCTKRSRRWHGAGALPPFLTPLSSPRRARSGRRLHVPVPAVRPPRRASQVIVRLLGCQRCQCHVDVVGH
jgi:hypothetical protein